MTARRSLLAAVATAAVLSTAHSTGGFAAGRPVRLDSVAALDLVGAQAEVVPWRGRRAIHLAPLPGHSKDDTAILAVVKGTDFHDGVIELDVSGAPRADADPTSRGFVGLAFRVQGRDSIETFECFYIRPTNGRSEDQTLRNHSVQYQEYPDFSWKKLRADSPGVYESYADMQPGVWTHLKLEVHGTEARLFVGDASQPSLIVHDLKAGDTRGAIALWSYTSTEGYFSNLSVR